MQKSTSIQRVTLFNVTWEVEPRRNGAMLTATGASYRNRAAINAIMMAVDQLLKQRDIGKQVSYRQIWINDLEHLSWLTMMSA
jgi:hypothetical protein